MSSSAVCTCVTVHLCVRASGYGGGSGKEKRYQRASGYGGLSLCASVSLCVSVCFCGARCLRATLEIAKIAV